MRAALWLMLVVGSPVLGAEVVSLSVADETPCVKEASLIAQLERAGLSIGAAGALDVDVSSNAEGVRLRARRTRDGRLLVRTVPVQRGCDGVELALVTLIREWSRGSGLAPLAAMDARADGGPGGLDGGSGDRLARSSFDGGPGALDGDGLARSQLRDGGRGALDADRLARGELRDGGRGALDADRLARGELRDGGRGALDGDRLARSFDGGSGALDGDRLARGTFDGGPGALDGDRLVRGSFDGGSGALDGDRLARADDAVGYQRDGGASPSEGDAGATLAAVVPSNDAGVSDGAAPEIRVALAAGISAMVEAPVAPSGTIVADLGSGMFGASLDGILDGNATLSATPGTLTFGTQSLTLSARARLTFGRVSADVGVGVRGFRVVATTDGFTTNDTEYLLSAGPAVTATVWVRLLGPLLVMVRGSTALRLPADQLNVAGGPSFSLGAWQLGVVAGLSIAWP